MVERTEQARMRTMSKITSGAGVLATVIAIGGIALFVGDFAIKTPLQWYKGKCSEEYTRQYRAKFQWFQPTCVLADDDESVSNQERCSAVTAAAILMLHARSSSAQLPNG
jgi:hypothetical protein